MTWIRALQLWFNAHDKYHRASQAYNERLTLVRAERERGNWSMDTSEEYARLNECQSLALQADNILYETLTLIQSRSK
jgi:hypothetical protein